MHGLFTFPIQYRKMSQEHYGSSGIPVEGENELFCSVQNKPICTDYLPPRAKDDFIDLETFFILTIFSLAFNFDKTTIPMLIPCCPNSLGQEYEVNLDSCSEASKSRKKNDKKVFAKLVEHLVNINVNVQHSTLKLH